MKAQGVTVNRIGCAKLIAAPFWKSPADHILSLNKKCLVSAFNYKNTFSVQCPANDKLTPHIITLSITWKKTLFFWTAAHIINVRWNGCIMDTMEIKDNSVSKSIDENVLWNRFSDAQGCALIMLQSHRGDLTDTKIWQLISIPSFFEESRAEPASKSPDAPAQCSSFGSMLLQWITSILSWLILWRYRWYTKTWNWYHSTDQPNNPCFDSYILTAVIWCSYWGEMPFPFIKCPHLKPNIWLYSM